MWNTLENDVSTIISFGFAGCDEDNFYFEIQPLESIFGFDDQILVCDVFCLGLRVLIRFYVFVDVFNTADTVWVVTEVEFFELEVVADRFGDD